MLFINGKIMTMDANDRDIDCGFIKIDGGKITEVGGMSSAPAADKDEEVVDMTGKLLLPGFIDSHSHIGLQEDGVGTEGDDINEMTDPFTPNLRALDGINPFDRCFEEAKQAGVTCVAVSPGSSNPIGGQICAMKTDGRWIDKMVVAEPLAMKMAFGENPKGIYSEKSQAPSTRMATAAIIRENLAKAEKYMHDMEKALEGDDDEPDYDAKFEAMIPVLKREMKVHIHAHRAYDILTGIRISNEFGLDYILVHCTEGHLIADILGDMKATAICGPLICARVKPELSNMSLDNCKKLADAGVNIAICTDHPVIPVDFLQTSVQVACANGMNARDALKAVTISAAKAVGIDHRLGSITVGKDADILVYASDPMTGCNKPEAVYINGVKVAG